MKLFSLGSAYNFSRNARLYLLGAIFIGFGSAAFFVLLNLYIKSLGYGEGFAGEVNSVKALGAVIGALPIAYLCCNNPIKNILIACALMMSLGHMLLVFTSSVPLMLVGAFIGGAGFTGSMVASAPFIMRNTEPGVRTTLFTTSHGIAVVMSALSSVIGGWAVGFLAANYFNEVESFRAVLCACCVIVLLSCLFFSMIEKQKPKPEEYRTIKSFVFSRSWGTLAKLSIPVFIIGIGAGMTIPFLNLYFSSRFGSSTGTIGAYFSVCQAFVAIGVFATPYLASRYGHIYTIVGSQLFSVPFMLVLAFTNMLPFALGAFFLRAMLMNMGAPLANQFAMEVVDKGDHSATNAMRSLSWSAAWMVGTYFGGWSIELHGYTPTILATAGLYALSSALYFVFFNKHRYRRIGISLGAAIPDHRR